MNFYIFLFIVSLVYLIVFLFWSMLKSLPLPYIDKIIFCQTCFTFASIFIFLWSIYFFFGVEFLPLRFLAGLTATGIAYKIQGDFDRLKEKKAKLEDHPYKGFWKEFFYQTRLFWAELALLNIGLILMKGGYL